MMDVIGWLVDQMFDREEFDRIRVMEEAMR